MLLLVLSSAKVAIIMIVSNESTLIFWLIILQESELLQLDSASQILSKLSDIPSEIDDADELLTTAIAVSKSLSEEEITSLRKKHLAILMAGQGAIINPEQTKNLPKEVRL